VAAAAAVAEGPRDDGDDAPRSRDDEPEFM